jgi:SAM-dependent methyltransferase
MPLTLQYFSHQFIAHFMTAYEATTSVPSLVAACHGTVLELGPAIGNQLGYFTKPDIEHIYGIEPNGLFMDDLRARIVKEGLEGRYTPIVGGVEDLDILAVHGVTEGSLDTVLSIQVLCSVKDPEEAARAIYALLKEGGELIFWEHHSSDDWVTWIVQSNSFTVAR